MSTKRKKERERQTKGQASGEPSMTNQRQMTRDASIVSTKCSKESTESKHEHAALLLHAQWREPRGAGSTRGNAQGNTRGYMCGTHGSTKGARSINIAPAPKYVVGGMPARVTDLTCATEPGHEACMREYFSTQIRPAQGAQDRCKRPQSLTTAASERSARLVPRRWHWH